MRVRWLLFFLTAANAKLLPETVTTSCAITNDFAAHFSDASLVTINILHVDENHKNMAGLVDLVLKLSTKVEKPISVRHTLLIKGSKISQVIRRKSTHVIIVWNHVSLSEFLDLIPEEIVGDRRGKYVILFAYNVPRFCFKFKRFAAHVLARFWKQFGIVNVCLHVPCSCDPNKVYQYHPFLRQIDVFNISDLHEKSISMKDLKQYPLRVSMFQRVPTAFQPANDPLLKFYEKKVGLRNMVYSGVDGFIMETLSKVLNFRPVYLETDYYEYGRFLENGTAVGSLGDVVYRRVHIAGNGRFVEDYGSNAEFSLSYQNDYVCFVVPKSQKVPQWIMLFHCFTSESWLAFLAVFVVAALLWRALNGDFLTFYAIFINSPTTLNSLTQKQKLFLIFCLSYNLIIMGVFQGTFTTSFSTISYYPDITTLEALAKSGLTISSNVDVFKDDNNSLATTLKNLQQPTNGNWALKRAALQRDVAGIERRLDAMYHIQKRFLDENGLPLIHIVDECITSHFIAFIVPKDSPFVEQFNCVIQMLNVGGFTQKWYNDITSSEISRSRSTALRSKDEKKVLLLSDIQAAFYILVIGLSVAFCVFLNELWQNRQRVHQYLP